MPSLPEAKRRHARHYLDALYELNQRYRQGGESALAALRGYE